MLRLRSPFARYGLAVAATALASLLRFLSGPPDVHSDLSYFGFTVAIFVSSILGGLGPGLFATGLSAFASAYLFLAPLYSLDISSEDQLARLILFAGDGVLLSFAGQLVHYADTTEANSGSVVRYLSAVLFVSIATGLKLLVFEDLERALPFTFFYTAVAASAWLGGFGPGLSATLLASLSARYFFLIPRYSLSVSSPINAARVTFFILEGILISGLSAMYPRARRLASDAIRLLREYGGRLFRAAEDMRAIRRTSSDLIWEWDTAANRMIRGATELDSRDTPTVRMTLGTWLQQIHPEDRSAVAASLNSALRGGGEEWVCEYRRLRPDGASTNVADHAHIFRDAQGNPVRLVGRSSDITDSKRAAVTIRASQGYRSVFEQSPLAILVTDNALHITSANRAATDLLGYSNSQFVGMHAEKIFAERRRNILMETLLELTPGRRSNITIEEDCVRANGELFRAKVSGAIISILDNGSTGWVIMIEEIS